MEDSRQKEAEVGKNKEETAMYRRAYDDCTPVLESLGARETPSQALVDSDTAVDLESV